MRLLWISNSESRLPVYDGQHPNMPITDGMRECFHACHELLFTILLDRSQCFRWMAPRHIRHRHQGQAL